MTTHDVRCTLICCTFDRERANRGPGRRNLTPLYSPVVTTRDVATGATIPPAAANLRVVVLADDAAAGATTSEEIA